jgi:type VI protein secretion system component VasK
MKLIASALILLMSAACSGNSSQQSAADNQADQLDNAAEQSTPEAAAVLENQADAIRDNGAAGAPGQPGSTTQQALEEAGQAQATGPASSPGVTPPARQALPSGAEKGTPPPTTTTR